LGLAGKQTGYRRIADDLSGGPLYSGYRKAFDAEAKRLNMSVIALDAGNDRRARPLKPRT